MSQPAHFHLSIVRRSKPERRPQSNHPHVYPSQHIPSLSTPTVSTRRCRIFSKETSNAFPWFREAGGPHLERLSIKTPASNSHSRPPLSDFRPPLPSRSQ